MEQTPKKLFKKAVIAVMAVEVLKSGLVAVTATGADGAQHGPWLCGCILGSANSMGC
jgi:hypothetical protein